MICTLLIHSVYDCFLYSFHDQQVDLIVVRVQLSFHTSLNGSNQLCEHTRDCLNQNQIYLFILNCSVVDKPSSLYTFLEGGIKNKYCEYCS